MRKRNEKRYQVGLRHGLRGIVNHRINDEDYLAGVAEGDERYNLMLASPFDHIGLMKRNGNGLAPLSVLKEFLEPVSETAFAVA